MGRHHRDPDKKTVRGPGRKARRQPDLVMPVSWKGSCVSFAIERLWRGTSFKAVGPNTGFANLSWGVFCF